LNHITSEIFFQAFSCIFVIFFHFSRFSLLFPFLSHIFFIFTFILLNFFTLFLIHLKYFFTSTYKKTDKALAIFNPQSLVRFSLIFIF